MATADSQHVVVIGAGIAGLTAAWQIAQAGCRVTVLEKEKHIGGRMMSIAKDGFVMDVGATVLFDSYHQMRQLITDAGLDAEIVKTSDLIGIPRNGTMHRFRAGTARDLLLTRLFTTRSKIKLIRAMNRVRRRYRTLDWTDGTTATAADFEDLADFAVRNLTPELLEYLIKPLSMEYSGLPAVRISMAAVLGGLQATAGIGYFNSPHGVQFLPDALARNLHIELGATATNVEKRDGHVAVTWNPPFEDERTQYYDGAVIATPAHAVTTLAPGLTSGQAAFLDSIRYSTTMVVALGLDRPPAEPAMWIMIPESLQPDLGAIVLDHNKAPGRVPDGSGYGLVTTYWQDEWSHAHWDVDDTEVVADAIATTSGILPGIDGHVITSHVQRWDPCVIGWTPGSFSALKNFSDSLDEHSPIQLAGDYFGLSATNNSLASGERAATRILNTLLPELPVILRPQEAISPRLRVTLGLYRLLISLYCSVGNREDLVAHRSELTLSRAMTALGVVRDILADGQARELYLGTFLFVRAAGRDVELMPVPRDWNGGIGLQEVSQCAKTSDHVRSRRAIPDD